MNKALKTVTNLCEAKKYTMANTRQISKVPAMNIFVFSLKNRVLLFNESDFQDTTEHTRRGRLFQHSPIPPPGGEGPTYSLNCIYQLLNVLLL